MRPPAPSTGRMADDRTCPVGGGQDAQGETRILFAGERRGHVDDGMVGGHGDGVPGAGVGGGVDDRRGRSGCDRPIVRRRRRRSSRA